MVADPPSNLNRALLAIAVVGSMAAVGVAQINFSGFGQPRYGMSFENASDEFVRLSWRLSNSEGASLERSVDLAPGGQFRDPYVTGIAGDYLLEVVGFNQSARHDVHFGNGWCEPMVMVGKGRSDGRGESGIDVIQCVA